MSTFIDWDLDFFAIVNNSNSDEEMSHYFCECDAYTSLCGIKFEEELEEIDDDSSVDCVVCIDLYDQVCSKCGE